MNTVATLPAPKPQTLPIIRFTGRDRAGRPVGGACSGRRPDRLAEILYNRGWRELSIRTTGGVEVGGIGPHPDTGRRVWWAEW